MITKAELKRYKSLKVKKYRDKYGEFIAEGFKIVETAITSSQIIKSILIQGSVSNEEKVKKLMKMAAKASIPVHVLKKGDFYQISSMETPPGVLAVIEKYKKPSIKVGRPYIVLDAIKDPGNLGSIIRSADWFGIENIVIGKDSVDLYNPKVIQATMGSIFNVNVIQDQDLDKFLKTLKTQNYKIIATSLKGNSDKLNLNNKFAVLIGNEAKGLNPNLLKYANVLYKIPGANRAESLNVSVASGIIMYQIFTQLK